MIKFKGFGSLEEAETFMNKNGKGAVCGVNGPNKVLHDECVKFGGLDPVECPYAVVWNDYGW